MHGISTTGRRAMDEAAGIGFHARMRPSSMTLQGGRRRFARDVVPDRPTDIRMAAVANMALGLLTILSTLLAEARTVAFWSVGFAGIGLMLWGALDAWAAIAHHLRGTKLLAMFMAILGLVIAGNSFINQQTGAYRYATIVIGAVVFGVSLIDAVISPDEDRRDAFEPRRPEDIAPPP